MRILSLNLNHRTYPKAVPRTMLQALAALKPDVLCFNEFVAGPANEDLQDNLAAIGLTNIAVSACVKYARGRTQNQILVASGGPIHGVREYSDAPEMGGNTNTLTVQVGGFELTCLRAPAYELMRDWREYWHWLSGVIEGDIIVGDLNVDPSRGNSRDRVFGERFRGAEWQHHPASGGWSYRGNNGSQASLDHILTRPGIVANRCEYIQQPFVPDYTDHAVLVADVCEAA